ncbi:hypothetical protein EJB05_16696, partial [Eragrostis curvula]
LPPFCHRRRASTLRRLSRRPEPFVYVAPVELPRPPHEHQRHERASHRGGGDDEERPPEAVHADARLVCTGERPSVLPGRLGVVDPPYDAHVEHVDADGAGDGDEVVERGVALEPEQLGDDGVQQRPLRAEAEADEHGRQVERAPRRAERDEDVAGAGGEQHRREHERPRDPAPRQQQRLRGVPGGDAAGVVPDADEGDEGVDGLGRVAQRLPDLAHAVDRRQRPAGAAGDGREQHQHVHAHQRLRDGVVLPVRRRAERVAQEGPEARRRRRRRRLRFISCFVDDGHRRQGGGGGCFLDDGRRLAQGLLDLELLLDPVLLLDEDNEREEEEDEEPGGRRGVGGARKAGLPLHDDHDEDVRGERDGDVEQAEEDAAAANISILTVIRRDDADGAEERDGDGGGQPGDEQDERLGVSAAVEREVELREDGAAEADVSLEQPQHGAAAALGKVADAGDERAGTRERLRVGPRAYVGAHEPHRRPRHAAGEGEVHHEVAGQVHGGADGEHGRRRRYFVEQPRGDAHVAAQVLEEGQRGDGALTPNAYVAPDADRISRHANSVNHRPVSTCRANCAVSTSAATPPLNADAMAQVSTCVLSV